MASYSDGAARINGVFGGGGRPARPQSTVPRSTAVRRLSAAPKRAGLVDSSGSWRGSFKRLRTVTVETMEPREALGSCMAVVRAHVGDVVA